jgi:translation initiation factor 4E
VTWGQTLRSVYTFNTVEDFWCLYNNILAPSRLIMGTDFHLFKEGIEPKWEDAKCAKGGKWTYCFPKSKEVEALDENWLNVLLAMIGEQFCEPSEICGAVISVRGKQHRIALWTRSASNEADQMAIGRHFKTVLEMPENEKIGYLVHDDAIRWQPWEPEHPEP